jgi:hemolysin-activating ACP:hemolysin acyltransferase
MLQNQKKVRIFGQWLLHSNKRIILALPCKCMTKKEKKSGRRIWIFMEKCVPFGHSLSDCPWYQGQYEDAETGLYYNRFRYYSPEMMGILVKIQ